MLYKVLSLHHEEEDALFFSVQRPSRRLSLVDLKYVLYRIGPCLAMLGVVASVCVQPYSFSSGFLLLHS